MPPDDSAELVRGVLAGDAKAIAATLERVEDVRPGALSAQRELLRELEAQTPAAHTSVGLTGPPGAGKSTLAGALIRHWLGVGAGVGMTAIDPSSRRSGGALLGDRARLRFTPDEPVFVRSMAARDRLGGLAPATRAAVVALRAAFDWTLVETVGVGQSEIDVASVVDSVVLVLQPGSGDTLQFMKAGILEIPDVLVVHKWDLGAEAERTLGDLQSMLSLVPRSGSSWSPPALGVSAETGHGVAELADTLAAHRAHLDASGELAAHRTAARTAWAMELFERRFGTLGLERVGGTGAARARIEAAEGTALDAYEALSAEANLD